MISRHADMLITAKPNMRGGDGTAHLTAIFPVLPAHARLFSVIELQPGESIGYHVHENETEMFYFMEGTAQVQDDEETHVLHPGDALSTPSGHGHSVRNTGDGPLRFVAAIILD